MSLRTRVLLAALLAIAIPLTAYLALDSTLNRKNLLNDQANSLRIIADSMNAIFMTCDDMCVQTTQDFVSSMDRIHPEIEIIIVDRQMRVIAATEQSLIGHPWHEPQFPAILAGELDFEWHKMEHHGIPVMDITIPMRDADNNITGALHLAKPIELVQERLRESSIRYGVFVAIVIISVVAILSTILYRIIVLRLVRIGQEIREISGLSGIEGPRGKTKDEIQLLHHFLNRMVGQLAGTTKQLQEALDDRELLLEQVNSLNAALESEIVRVRTELEKAQEGLLWAEHLSTIGKLAAGLAHEIRNPLFIIRATAESIKKTGDEGEQVASDIIEEVDRVNDIISRLLDLARPIVLGKERLNVAALIRDVVSQAAKRLPEGVMILGDVDAASDLWIMGDSSYLKQALANIIDNSVQAIRSRGEIKISAGHDADGRVYISISDDGCGIDKSDLALVFDPFYSKRSGGTGLGLPAVKKVLDLHKAEISIESQPEQGTIFRICFEEAYGGLNA